MINQKSLDAVNKSRFSKEFLKPLYDSYCFSRIPGTLKKVLTGKGENHLPEDCFGKGEYDAVIVIFIDGFGWRFFEKYQDKYPFLQHFVKEGIATKLTSQFPSTTACHVTCINTGLSVGQTGIYEWFYYEPKVDRIIVPLLFSFAGDKETNSLHKAGFQPEDIFPRRTLYEDLKEEGVNSFVLQHLNIAHSSYSKAMFKGASTLPYSQLPEGLENIWDLLKAQKEKSYFYLYYGEIDAIGHRAGIDAKKFEDAVDYCLTCLENFWQKRNEINKRTCCILVADHGITSVDPKTTIYLNKDFPEITRYLKRNKEGSLLVPAGSCRDFFLHIQEEHLQEAKEKLGDFLKGKADIYYTKELIEQGLFGEVTKNFLDRVGNLVILPFEHEAVWWYEKGRFEQHFYGSHGGLTKEELETIFLFVEAP